MKIEKCKGFRDLSPEEMYRFRRVEDVFRERCLKWGYQEVRTPTLEYLYLFTSVGTLTLGKLGRVYSFLDWDGWSGERVVLKPDGTIPVARLYVDGIKKGLARLFYVTNVFMFDETGKESRERWQCGAELIGAGSALADVELVALAAEVLQALGLDEVKIRLSHAGLIKEVLSSLELSDQEQSRVFDQILDGDMEALAGIKPDKPELVEALGLILGLRGKSSGFLKNIRAIFSRKLPQFSPSLDSFISVVDQIEAIGCDCQIDLASGKGFEYYTGVIFHLYAGQKVVGGGGRYDALIPMMGGRDTPAAGFALYLDKLLTMIAPKALAELGVRRILIRFGRDRAKEGLDIARRLRQTGFAVELEIDRLGAAGCDFVLEVRDKSPRYALTDRVNKQRLEIGTADEVLAVLGKNVQDRLRPGFQA